MVGVGPKVEGGGSKTQICVSGSWEGIGWSAKHRKREEDNQRASANSKMQINTMDGEWQEVE